MLVYIYFQIPLMVIVFLPARRGPAAAVARGGRDPRREHLATTGATSPDPILPPSFIGALLLLFTNAFSRLRHRGRPGLPGRPRSCRCRSAARSAPRCVLGQENVGKAMALGMVVIVAVVMTALRRARAAYDRGGWAGERRRRPAAPAGAVPLRVVVGVIGALLRPAAGRRCSSSPPAAPGGGRTAATRGDAARRRRGSTATTPSCATGLIASAGLAVLTVAIMLAAAGADDDLGAAAAARAAPHGRVHLPAAAHHPRHRAGRRADAGLRLGHLLPRRSSRLAVASPTSCWCCPTPTARWTPGCAPSTSRTLAEAARSLGASWSTVMWRVILPNMRTAVLLGVVPVGGAGARRVHHRQPAQPRQPAGGDQPARQARRARSRSPSSLAALLVRVPACCSPCPSSAAAAAPAAPRRAAMSTRPRARPRRPPPPEGVGVRLTDLRRSYGTVRALDGLDLSHRARRAGRPARPLGLRQDHRAAAARRPGGRRRGPRRGRRPGHHPGARPTSATWGWCSRPTACSRT